MGDSPLRTSAPAANSDSVHAGSASCGSLQVTFLGSGSSGNASVIEGPSGALLLDCGFSARETVRRLESSGTRPESIEAILLTHEHGDHMRGVRVLAKRLGVPVYATQGTRTAGRLDQAVEDVRDVRPGESFEVAGMQILAFDVSHDAEEPVGDRLDGGCGARIGIATDTGHMTDMAAEALGSCDILGLECNHDDEMLASGPYPWFLKERIRSHRGHLSNAAASEALRYLSSDRLTSVFALHISEANNTPALAVAAACESLGEGVEVCAVLRG